MVYDATGARYIESVVTEEYLQKSKVKLNHMSEKKLNDKIHSGIGREVTLQIKLLEYCACLEEKGVRRGSVSIQSHVIVR